MALSIHGNPTTNIFRLMGADENSATFALGWALEKCEGFRKSVLSAWVGSPFEGRDTTISLQKHGEDGGYTDIEIYSERHFHLIIEAKRSWDLPTEEQLQRYRPRLSSGRADIQRLISVTSASTDFAKRHLPEHIDGAPVVHQSWGELRRIARSARSEARSFEEKLWLDQLSEHLREFVAMERITDNTVYVVSLSIDAMIEGADYTWIDAVEKDGCYFHPMGGAGWPVQPPNYIGFRYHGKLQSVHHIDSYEVTDDLSKVNPRWPRGDMFHFVYRLGPPIRPATEVRTGNIFRAGRVYCAIDTLLSGAFKTISEARDETKRRLSEPVAP
ncbi:hypothetical protein EI171_21015 [Bradyrhizobium sp. LCT2]|uniref:hypothetical protein n=1 Tax=Bradyrhizobium sp. LCT2 TaxID=2493093 RepID=UPI0013745626|nr:hypothetical protein [Bradyrhizobium sp. LCT2]QHP69550.1 hypothetical protein EI171_21015 [Bradyrhizobium sp. LCT2]